MAHLFSETSNIQLTHTGLSASLTLHAASQEPAFLAQTGSHTFTQICSRWTQICHPTRLPPAISNLPGILMR